MSSVRGLFFELARLSPNGSLKRLLLPWTVGVETTFMALNRAPAATTTHDKWILWGRWKKLEQQINDLADAQAIILSGGTHSWERVDSWGREDWMVEMYAKYLDLLKESQKLAEELHFKSAMEHLKLALDALMFLLNDEREAMSFE